MSRPQQCRSFPYGGRPGEVYRQEEEVNVANPETLVLALTVSYKDPVNKQRVARNVLTIPMSFHHQHMC